MDEREALLRLGGNRALYDRLLRQFLTLESLPGQISEALAAGERSTAERLAHSLKGAAAGIGAGTLARVARELEQAVREGAPCEELRTRLQSSLEAVLRHVRATLPPEEVLPSAPPAADVVERMDGYLRDFDVAAGETLQAHRDYFRELLGADFESFEKQVSGYDFGEARATLARRTGP
ncbi:hypothetical protein ABS71_22450 [bacterium SCN 62-11]|nr:MAG: hypothetical protein ABS71_22450 [bacterium SCN 62-11]